MAEQPTGGMGVETIELNELIQETRKSLMSAIPDLDIYSKCRAWAQPTLRGSLGCSRTTLSPPPPALPPPPPPPPTSPWRRLPLACGVGLTADR